MPDIKDRDFIQPFPRPFPMHAMQFFSEDDLNSAQRKKIATFILGYYKQCAEAEATLAEGIITAINNLDSKR